MPSMPSSKPPPELAAASERSVTLSGEPVSIRLVVPRRTANLLQAAIDTAGTQQIYLTIEDIEVDHNPGVSYGVFLTTVANGDDASRPYLHVGNISFFGVEMRAFPDVNHDEAPGFRHIFDATRAVHSLRANTSWDPDSITVTFELLLPVPPPGREAELADSLDEQRRWAAETPVRIGRVGLFVY